MISLAVVLPGAHTAVPNTIPSFSVNAIIVMAVALVFLYGFIAGYAALIRESISVYVGLVLANNFGKPAHDYLMHSAGKGWPVSQTEIQLILLLLPVVVLQFGRKHAHHPRANMVVTVVLAFATAMLLVSSVLTQLSPLTLEHVTEASALANAIHRLNLVWLAAVPIAAVLSAILHRKHSSHR